MKLDEKSWVNFQQHVGYNDVGVQCGGWGHIVLELSIEDRDKLSK
jgi:hypothetical protein